MIAPTVLLFLAPLPAPPATDLPARWQDPPAVPGSGGPQEVVVTATAFPEDPLGLPWASSTIAGEELRRSARTLAESLRNEPSVLLQKTAYGQSSPFLRGFTGFRNVLLVDGVRLNHSVFRDGPNQYWSTVDVYTVDQLELVRGPSSVLYGSDAIGGTVNAVLRRAERGAEGSGFAATGGLLTRYASAEDSWIGRGEVQLRNGDDWALLAGASLKDFNDLEGGADTGRLAATGYEERDADLRLDGYLESGVELSLVAQTARQIDVPRTHKTIFAVPYANSSVGSELRREHDQVRDLVFARARWTEAGGLFDSAEITLSVQRHAEERDRRRAGSGAGTRRDIQGFEVLDKGLLARFESEGWGRWSWGLEGHHEAVDSFKDNFTGGVSTGPSVQGPVGDDATYTTLAAYVQNEHEFEDWSVIPGVRYTRTSLEADRVANPGAGPAVIRIEDDWNALVGSVRGVRWLGEDSQVYAGVSQGFRAPNLSDTTSFDTTSVVEFPTRGLDPEHYVQAELGTKAVSGDWSWQAAAYRTWISDMIVRSPTGALSGGVPVVRKDNVGDGWIHGLELGATWAIDRDFSVEGVVSWMDGEIDQLKEPAAVVVREPLSRLLPLNTTVTARWAPPAERHWAEAWVWAVDGQSDLSLRDQTDTSRIPPQGTPGFTLFGLAAGIDVTEDTRVSLLVDNLGDKDYRIHGSGLNGPGRNVVIIWEQLF